MSAHSFIAGPVGGTLNRLIALDPDAGQRLAPLSGCRLRVRLTAPELTVDARFTPERLALSAPDDDNGEPDVTVTGRLDDLLAMLRDPEHAAGRLRFDGDPAIAQRIQRFFRELDVDWEEGLARFLGDIPAHQVGRVIRGIGDWLRHSGDAARSSLVEYLTEERRDLPTRPELEAFLDDVDGLRADTDRLAARVARLEQQRGGGR
ncbi:SCP2 sterol-binding domain-containing protein [Aquisalimonas lutea]|uniref:ubiquinone biosynthesis accessory factor UbiJ n=1 Tax=Aquisalimonas lutea TaxID=1327750 RepID=UPI0025B51479|nr:SCP2 sterol-binding domain-containing protein [Aquisalimonas lutea]MDN3516645.1 SCP2 sterol-binding domain-containing protein [Aquisalimonas lutea]